LLTSGTRRSLNSITTTSKAIQQEDIKGQESALWAASHSRCKDNGQARSHLAQSRYCQRLKSWCRGPLRSKLLTRAPQQGGADTCPGEGLPMMTAASAPLGTDVLDAQDLRLQRPIKRPAPWTWTSAHLA
jgi:hypothetical protein